VSPAQRRFLLLEQGVGAGVVNFLINAGIAWLLVRGRSEMPLWGQQSIAGDTIATSLILPFVTSLVVTALARRQLRSGAIVPLGWTRETHPALRCLPAGTAGRGLVLGVACVAILAPAALLLLRALGVERMSPGGFVGFKAAFAALAGMLVTPPIALWAIAVPVGPVRRDSAA
jgi:hypothetical protein